MPLTNELFPIVRDALGSKDLRQRFLELLVYFYPSFRTKWENYPNFEEFLSLVDVYVDWASAVKTQHRFSPKEIAELRRDVLRAISRALHERLKAVDIANTPVFRLVQALQKGDVIITFNWDLTVERALHEIGRGDWVSYELSKTQLSLLKPHGSLDWFDRRTIKLNPKLVRELIPGKGQIQVFQRFRFPNVEKPIVPAIIPPVVQKTSRSATADRPEEFDAIWRDTWKALRRADQVYFIGYSLPPEDLHVRFVLRSALRANERTRNGALPITVVNPDREISPRIERLVESPLRRFECGLERVSLDELLSGKRRAVRATLV